MSIIVNHKFKSGKIVRICAKEFDNFRIIFRVDITVYYPDDRAYERSYMYTTWRGLVKYIKRTCIGGI